MIVFSGTHLHIAFVLNTGVLFYLLWTSYVIGCAYQPKQELQIDRGSEWLILSSDYQLYPDPTNSSDMELIFPYRVLTVLVLGINVGYCTTCEINQYNSSDQCFRCPLHCVSCTSESYCATCDSGFYGTTCSYDCSLCHGGNCSKTYCNYGCETGYYMGSFGECIRCRSNCISCSEHNTCSSCVSGKFGSTCGNMCLDSNCKDNICSVDKGLCANDCEESYYFDLSYGRCYPCLWTCLTCSSSTVCDSCPEGKWFTDCLAECPDNCKTCAIATGECTDCYEGYYMFNTSCCEFGKWGDVCESLCYGGCSQCYQTGHGSCSACFEGYTLVNNTCLSCPTSCATCTPENVCKSCINGYVLLQNACSHCSVGCETCSSQNVCLSCMTDYVLSENACVHCPVVCSTCSFSNVCTSCITGYVLSGNTCIQCPSECSSCSSPNVCASCIIGYVLKGNICSIQCPAMCSDCSISNGCSSCTTGYVLSGTTCIKCPVWCSACSSPTVCTSCTTGYVLSGNACSLQCPIGCATCSSSNFCTSCATGYVLSRNACSLQCPAGCVTCSSSNLCTSCATGYVLSRNACSLQCPARCATCSSSNVCFSCSTGYVLSDHICILCPYGCEICSSSSICTTCSFGYYKSGYTCTATSANQSSQSNQPGNDATQTVVIGGAAGGGVFLLIIAGFIVACIVIRRRKRRPHKNTDEQIATADIEHLSSANENENENNTTAGCIYATPNNVKQKKDVQQSSIPIRYSNHEAPPLSRHSVLEDVDGDLEDLDENEGEMASFVKVIISADNVYYTNVAGLKRSRIQIDKLQDYVDMKTKDDFLNEFQGLSRPCNDALKPVNRGKNRYKSVYPYDVSRVKLTDGGLDFINANYIDGYNEPNAYIASQGPTDAQMKDYVDFWRMVWQERVEKIAMLTNLFEDGKMKCEQYWPDTGESHTYGDVTVTCMCEDMHAEHTVKDFTVSKGSEKRSLHHIHFTAWPDKGVPDDVTSLIEFRQKVLNTRAELGGPVIVHCSAGAGRTGTYIALDILTKEGKAETSVDIFGCVTGMRSQRVAMIQTEAQYEYLHNSVVHALTFDCQPIPGHIFQQYVSNNTVKLDVQFEHIGSTEEKKTTEETEAIQRNRKLHDKNRKHADIPGDRHRPRLHLQRKPGSSDYINAIYLNSYTTKKRYIVAQTPLRGMLADFLCLIVQEQCSCIVSMDDETMIDNTMGRCLPAANQDLKHGNFEIHCLSCESKPHHTVRTLTIKHQGLSGPDEKTVYHFQFADWKKNIPIPSDPSSFLNLVLDVDKTSAESDNNGPMLIHCLNGAERSGLFCAVSVLIQKMEIEHEVSVVNTVRQIRSRRGDAITNKYHTEQRNNFFDFRIPIWKSMRRNTEIDEAIPMLTKLSRKDRTIIRHLVAYNMSLLYYDKYNITSLHSHTASYV